MRKKLTSPLAGLSPRDVRKARTLRALGWTQSAIALRFKVSQAAISLLLNNKTYKKVA